MIVRLFIALLAIACAGPALGAETIRIVYIGIEGDAYYEPQVTYTGLSLKDRQRPVDGARLAMRDASILGRALNLAFELDERLVTSGLSVREAVVSAREKGAIAFLLDLPEDLMDDALAAGGDGLFFNIRLPGNRWRGEDCRIDLYHTYPSRSMLTDALAQHLRFRGWTRILLLRGENPEDIEEAESVRKSINKFGLKTVDEREFELTNDPRRRDLSNIALLTGPPEHDVIWIVDSEGEFGRYISHATYLARPLIGSEGLGAEAWDWTYERHGAPQLNQRFRRLAGRSMTSEDWAAWAAVRVMVDAVSRSRSGKPESIKTELNSDRFTTDLYKGAPGSFRRWDGQLRQPILLATHNAVISVAPLEGFEHQTNTLDTLGVDKPESHCNR